MRGLVIISAAEIILLVLFFPRPRDGRVVVSFAGLRSEPASYRKSGKTYTGRDKRDQQEATFFKVTCIAGIDLAAYNESD